MGNWSYNTGIYDVAQKDGTYMGSINITVDNNGNLNTQAAWYDNNNNQSSVSLTWVPLSNALAFNASSVQYDLSLDSTTTPTTFKNNDYEMRYNQNRSLNITWPAQNPVNFSVSVNYSSHNGTLSLSKDAVNFVSCLGKWTPSGSSNPKAGSQRVRITWDGTNLSWNVEWGSGVGAPKDQFTEGVYNSGTNQFSGKCNVVTAAAASGTWQATQTNPVPLPVPMEAHKKAV